jgi:hypothetical protein
VDHRARGVRRLRQRHAAARHRRRHAAPLQGLGARGRPPQRVRAVRRALRHLRRGRRLRAERRGRLHPPLRPVAARARAQGRRGDGARARGARGGRRAAGRVGRREVPRVGRDAKRPPSRRSRRGRGRWSGRERARTLARRHRRGGQRPPRRAWPAAARRGARVAAPRRARAARTSSGAAASPAARRRCSRRSTAQHHGRLPPLAARRAALQGVGRGAVGRRRAHARREPRAGARARPRGRALAAGEPPTAADEDVHTFIDRLLHEAVGSSRRQAAHGPQPQRPGGHGHAPLDDRRLRSARRGAARAAARALAQAETLQDGADARVHAPAARAAGVAAHWLLSHFWPLERDRARLAAARAAPASCRWARARWPARAFPVSRVLLKESARLPRVSPQLSIDAVGDRDFVAECCSRSRCRHAPVAAGRGPDPVRVERVRLRAFGDGFSTGRA